MNNNNKNNNNNNNNNNNKNNQKHLKIIKGSFIENQIRKKKNVMMISLWQKNQNSFGEIYGVSL